MWGCTQQAVAGNPVSGLEQAMLGACGAPSCLQDCMYAPRLPMYVCWKRSAQGLLALRASLMPEFVPCQGGIDCCFMFSRMMPCRVCWGCGP